MKYEIKVTSKFKKDLKLAKKQKKNIDLLFEVIDKLAKGKKLEDKFRDHELSGNFAGIRECYVESDWLLMYEIRENTLVLLLYRVGSHSELFE